MTILGATVLLDASYLLCCSMQYVLEDVQWFFVKIARHTSSSSP
jgi:hypothetical protein